jgi:hypothetical protein
MIQDIQLEPARCRFVAEQPNNGHTLPLRLDAKSKSRFTHGAAQ